MKYALITGCSGLIGSQSVDFFISKGYTIIGIDNHMRAYFFGDDCSTENTTIDLKSTYSNKFIHFDIDIRDFDNIKKIFELYSEKIEIVIHTAAQPSHDWASKEPMTDFTINALGTLNLLELTRLYSKEATFIFTSTNKVYGDNPNKLNLIEGESRYILKDEKYFDSIDENMSIDNCLHSVFGASKTSADILVQEYGKYFELNTVCFRGGCLTGPNHAGAELHGFLSYLIKCIVNNQKYKIFGYKGKQVRDNIHSWDLVNMFYHYHLNPKKGEVYNAGGGVENSISILEAIKKVNKICKKNLPDWEEWENFEIKENSRIGDHIYYVSNLDKFKTDYPNWEGITITLDDLIEQITINEIKKLNHGVIS
jgi:CDP-paratose 2-epimerase